MIYIRAVNLSIHQVKYYGADEVSDSSVKFNAPGAQSEIVPFCEVQLYDQNRREYIKSTWSDKNGVYSFPNLNLKDFKFFIIAHDPKGLFNGVIADNIGGPDVDS